MSGVKMYTVLVSNGCEVVDKFVVHEDDYINCVFESIDIFDCNDDCLHRTHKEKA